MASVANAEPGNDFISDRSFARVNNNGLMIKSLWAKLRRAAVVVGALVSFTPAQLQAHPAKVAPAPTAIEVVKDYLRASRARDFESAYGYITSIDRAVRDKT